MILTLLVPFFLISLHITLRRAFHIHAGANITTIISTYNIIYYFTTADTLIYYFPSRVFLYFIPLLYLQNMDHLVIKLKLLKISIFTQYMT